MEAYVFKQSVVNRALCYGRLKIIGKEFQKIYYKTILRQINTEETFLPFTVITNKDYFSRKRSICENLLSWYM